MATKTDLDGVAERVAILRLADKHESDAAFAAKLGISTQRLNAVMTGGQLSSRVALLMCQKIPGLTLDWLYRGRTEALTVDLAQRIEDAEAARKGTTSRRPKEAR